MRLAYERILAEADLRRAPLDPAVEEVLRTMIDDITARTSLDSNSQQFAELDDKWRFSRAYLELVAQDCGFADVCLLSPNNHATLYRDVAQVQLRLGSGQEGLTFPPPMNAGCPRQLRPRHARTHKERLHDGRLGRADKGGVMLRPCGDGP
ncbi:MAG TPA: hypothetical protein VFE10_03220 [Phenylobacterium sp.]|jgi:hypothetical protein|nr:hypothetical protein [Phenylobacterium sp.]